MGWMEQLGEEIAKLRRRSGLTQAELGKRIAEAGFGEGLRVSRQMIGLYEKGKVPPPFETLACIASILKAEQFVVEDLNVTFNRNGITHGPVVMAQQLELAFDKGRGVTVRIESTSDGVTIKAVSA